MKCAQTTQFIGVFLVVSLVCPICLAQEDSADFRFIKKEGDFQSLELNFDPPEPAEAATASDRFRTFSAIEQRLQNLAVENFVERISIGKSLAGRDIWALKISDPDRVMDGGDEDFRPVQLKEPVVIIDATMHAREWAAAEAGLQIAEKLIQGYKSGQDNYANFLVNNLEIYIIPVVNPDGLVYTQKSFQSTVIFRHTSPRMDFNQKSFVYFDRRLRRKNLRSHVTDENGEINEDPDDFGKKIDFNNLTPKEGMIFKGLLGVDINRNFDLNHDKAQKGRRLTDFGRQKAFSAPESAAIRDFFLARVIEQQENKIGKIHSYLDIHSFHQAIVMSENQASRMNNRLLANTMNRSLEHLVGKRQAKDSDGNIVRPQNDALRYPVIVTGDLNGGVPIPGAGIRWVAKDNDDKIAKDKQVGYSPPSMTIELPPRDGFEPNRDHANTRSATGFILPEVDMVLDGGDFADYYIPGISTVVSEASVGARLMMDFSAFPPYAERVYVWSNSGGDIVNPNIANLFQGYRTRSETERSVLRTDNPLKSQWIGIGRTRIWITFNKPMRVLKEGNAQVGVNYEEEEIHPTVEFFQKNKDGAKRFSFEVDSQTSRFDGWMENKTKDLDPNRQEPGFLRYQFDSWQGTFEFKESDTVDTNGRNIQLSIKATDLSGHGLDANPITIPDFNQNWTKYEDRVRGVGEEDTPSAGGEELRFIIKVDTKRPQVEGIRVED